MQAASSSRPHTSTCGLNTSMVQGQGLQIEVQGGMVVISTLAAIGVPWCRGVMALVSGGQGWVCCLRPQNMSGDAVSGQQTVSGRGPRPASYKTPLLRAMGALPHAAWQAAWLPGRPPGCLAGRLAGWPASCLAYAACKAVQPWVLTSMGVPPLLS
jgi:hypothetical protein